MLVPLTAPVNWQHNRGPPAFALAAMEKKTLAIWAPNFLVSPLTVMDRGTPWHCPRKHGSGESICVLGPPNCLGSSPSARCGSARMPVQRVALTEVLLSLTRAHLQRSGANENARAFKWMGRSAPACRAAAVSYHSWSSSSPARSTSRNSSARKWPPAGGKNVCV